MRKKLGRNRTRDRRREHLRARRPAACPLRSASEIPSPTTSASICANAGECGEIEVVAAIDAPRHDDADRRLMRLHVADLHRRGVRPQQRPARRRRRPSRPRSASRGRACPACRARGARRACSARRSSASSSSASGPSTIAKPMRVKIASSSVADDGQRMPVAEPRQASGQRDVDARRPAPRSARSPRARPARVDRLLQLVGVAADVLFLLRPARCRSAASSTATTLFLRPR